MQYSKIFSLAALLSTAAALPAPGSITFHGADPSAQYSMSVFLDNVDRPTNNPLSISSITSDTINVKAQCKIHTVDFPPALMEGPPNTWVVGPPQTITSISCGPAGNTPPPASISIEFQGADPTLGAKYTINVPLNGVKIPTNNPLSISTLVSSYAALASKCTFEYIDGSAALVALTGDTWAVGPPQTIKSVSCVA